MRGDEAPASTADQAPELDLPDLTEEQGSLLPVIAREALDDALGLEPFAGRGPTSWNQPWLHRPAATFVTLTQAPRGGPGRDAEEPRLRGCIGTVRPIRTLIEDLRSNTRAAALRDPRFPPLTREEIASDPVAISVSLLSPLLALRATSEPEALAALRPGEHGVVLEWGRLAGTYLPQVWHHFRRPEDFLASLKTKAGLPADFWAPDLSVWTFKVQSWRER